MPGNDDSSGKVAIINAVKSPLGFFVLVIIVLDGILIGAAVLSGAIPFWAPMGVLVFVVAGFFVTIWWKHETLYPLGNPILISLAFPEPLEVDLDVDKCLMEIRDERGKQKTKPRRANIIDGPGGWAIRLRGSEVGPYDAVNLELMEHNGRKWRVRSFSPFQNVREPVEVS